MAKGEQNGSGVGASGALSYAQVMGVWIAAGGAAASAPVMAAIATCESGRQPGIIQQGQPYGTTGWGLWQITSGDSEPSIGTNYQLLDPYTNAKAAVAKLKSQGLQAWTTWEDGCYTQYLQTGVQPTTSGVTNGEYEVIGTAPSGTTGTPSAGYAASGTTSSDSSSSSGDCLIHLDVVGCLLSKADAMRLLGGVLMGGALLVGAVGLVICAQAAGKKIGVKIPGAVKLATMAAA